MWTCPKCGRIFKNTNQNHFCGNPPKDIDEFLRGQDEIKRPYLEKVRDAIKSAIPEATERIAWGMPTFWSGENIIQFSAAKNHIGVHVGEEAIAAFAEKIAEYKPNKGTFHVPYEEPMPLELIRDMAVWCLNNAKAVSRDG